MQVFIVGPTSAAEFAEVVQWMRTFPSSAEIKTCRFLRDIPASSTAELILVLQQWPDEFTSSEMLALIDQHPFSRLVVCYGPWCESDGRTRHIWPQAVRVSLAEAPGRLRQVFATIRGGHSPLPLTATREETFQHDLMIDAHKRISPKRFCVLSVDTAFRDWLCDAFRDAGHIIDHSPMPSTDVVVWDADPWSPNGRERLAKVLPQCVGRPLIVMCGFLRRHEVCELLDAGVSLVLPKVLSHEQLLDRIEAVFNATLADEPTSSGILRVHQAG